MPSGGLMTRGGQAWPDGPVGGPPPPFLNKTCALPGNQAALWLSAKSWASRTPLSASTRLADSGPCCLRACRTCQRLRHRPAYLSLAPGMPH